jgi:succinate dehydrogenase hydrophobic anchor subunit
MATKAAKASWFESLMIATSLALVVLLPLEIVSWLIVSDPATHTSSWVADRWSNSLWRAVDWVFLIVALLHGAVSTMRWLTSAERETPLRRVGAELVAALCLALAVLGTYTLFSFDLG